MTKGRDTRYVSVLWANIEHAEALAACHATLFDKPWDKAAFEALLSNPVSTSLFARQGHPLETVGFIVGQLVTDEAEVLSIGVAKDWQRNGIGRKLIESFARAAKRAEAKRMFLDVAADNIPALVLYSRMGFKEIGQRKAYYERPGQPNVDALTLALTL